MAALRIYRLVTFIFILVLSLVILGLSAHLETSTVLYEEDDFLDDVAVQVHYTFFGLGIATGVFSLITVGPMLALDFFVPRSFTSHIWYELVVLSNLWVAWLATGGLAAAAIPTISCADVTSSSCILGEFAAVAAIGLIGWLALMVYNITELVFAIRAAHAGRRAWTTSIRYGFSTPVSPAAGVHAPKPAPADAYPIYQQGYPPSQPKLDSYPPSQPAYIGYPPQGTDYTAKAHYTEPPTPQPPPPLPPLGGYQQPAPQPTFSEYPPAQAPPQTTYSGYGGHPQGQAYGTNTGYAPSTTYTTYTPVPAPGSQYQPPQSQAQPYQPAGYEAV